MIWLLSWLVYGFIVGYLAKWVHHRIRKEEQPVGVLSTMGIGVAGSYMGGFINYLLHGTGSPFSPSGILMGTIGAVIVLIVYGVAKKRGD